MQRKMFVSAVGPVAQDNSLAKVCQVIDGHVERWAAKGRVNLPAGVSGLGRGGGGGGRVNQQAGVSRQTSHPRTHSPLSPSL